jgi:phage RecT family recombinase
MGTVIEKRVIEWDKPRPDRAFTKAALREFLVSYAVTIEAAMGETARRIMKVTDLIESIVAAANVDAKLLECSPVSLVYAAVLAARTGLRLGEPYREAYIANHYNEDLKVKWAQFRPTALGLKAIIFRSGKVAMVEWKAVRACDELTYRHGTDSFISHTPARLVPPHDGVPNEEKKAWAEKTKLTEAYAIVHYLSGFRQFVVLDREQVWRHRKRSKRQDQASSPWNTDEDSMWEKSAFIDLYKRLEPDSEMAAAIAALQDEESGTARLAPVLLPTVAMPLPASNYTPEPDPDGTEGVKARVAEKAAGRKSRAKNSGPVDAAGDADTASEAPVAAAQAEEASPEVEPADPADGESVELPPHTVALLERLETRAIGDEETIELLAWLGVESFADIAPTALERALAITDLKWLVRETKADIAATCAYFKAEGVAELSDSQLAAIVRRLSREVAA